MGFAGNDGLNMFDRLGMKKDLPMDYTRAGLYEIFDKAGGDISGDVFQRALDGSEEAVREMDAWDTEYESHASPRQQKYCCREWVPKYKYIGNDSFAQCLRDIVPSYWHDELDKVTDHSWNAFGDFFVGMGNSAGIGGLSSLPGWGVTGLENGFGGLSHSLRSQAKSLTRYGNSTSVPQLAEGARLGASRTIQEAGSLSKGAKAMGAIGVGVVVWTGGEWLASRLAIHVAYKTCGGEICVASSPAAKGKDGKDCCPKGQDLVACPNARR